MIKSTTAYVDIDEIKIPKNFERTMPDAMKIAERYEFFKRTAGFDREILVDENYNLIDGYSSYLVRKMVGLTKVRVLRLKVELTASECLKMAQAELQKMEVSDGN